MDDKMVTEWCPHCESEITMEWDTEERGFKAFCPVCGNVLMLCDECLHTVCEDGEPHDCDWCENTKSCHRNPQRKENDENEPVRDI